MKILHLVSNFRWTERVEPAADLSIAQARQVLDFYDHPLRLPKPAP